MNKQEDVKCDIFIRMVRKGKQKILHLKPENFEYNRDFINKFRTKESLAWESMENRLFSHKEIDKRCKKPETIINSILRKYKIN